MEPSGADRKNEPCSCRTSFRKSLFCAILSMMGKRNNFHAGPMMHLCPPLLSHFPAWIPTTGPSMLLSIPAISFLHRDTPYSKCLGSCTSRDPVPSTDANCFTPGRYPDPAQKPLPVPLDPLDQHANTSSILRFLSNDLLFGSLYCTF